MVTRNPSQWFSSFKDDGIGSWVTSKIRHSTTGSEERFHLHVMKASPDPRSFWSKNTDDQAFRRDSRNRTSTRLHFCTVQTELGGYFVFCATAAFSGQNASD